jgi:transcriptional regulator with XRE-family HTH domain
MTPTVRRRRLAAELRQLRKDAGVSLDDAAKHLGVSPSTLSRVETGQTGIRPPYVDALARLYGVKDSERDAMVLLAREARQRGWWHVYGLPEQYAAYIGFETEASSIRTYEPQTVPGLLQTEDYTRALTTAQFPETTPAELDQLVQVRRERQERLTSLRLWVIIGEPCLHYRVGDLDDQLRHLLGLMELPNITIQVLPYSAGAHPGMGGPFVLMGFPTDPDIVYLENLTTSLYLEGEADVGRYTLIFDHLRATALSQEETRRMIRRAQ